MAGWLNWAFNVFPTLRPCLNNFYPKMTGPFNPHRSIKVNNAIREDFLWALYHLKRSSGIRLLRATNWDPISADITVYCDACPAGMGFWYPILDKAYYSPTPPDAASSIIFYFETLCVYCALIDAASKASSGSRVVIFTDNLNTVSIYNSLSCLPVFNPLLRASMDILIDNDLDLRVLHVKGEENETADALSRSQFATALNLSPRISIQPFQPPLWTLGAAGL